MTRTWAVPAGHDNGLISRDTLFGAFSGIEVPDQLRANIERHWEDICALVDTLGSAGVDEATIERSVAQVVASYQAQLTNSIKTLHRDATDARR